MGTYINAFQIPGIGIQKFRAVEVALTNKKKLKLVRKRCSKCNTLLPLGLTSNSASLIETLNLIMKGTNKHGPRIIFWENEFGGRIVTSVRLRKKIK